MSPLLQTLCPDMGETAANKRDKGGRRTPNRATTKEREPRDGKCCEGALGGEELLGRRGALD